MLDFTQIYIDYRPFLFWTAVLTPSLVAMVATGLYFWAKYKAGTIKDNVVTDTVRFGVPIILTVTLLTSGVIMADSVQLGKYNTHKVENAIERTGQISRTVMTDDHVEYLLESGHIIRINLNARTETIDHSGRPGDVIIYKQYSGVDTMHSLYLKYEQRAKIIRIVNSRNDDNTTQPDIERER